MKKYFITRCIPLTVLILALCNVTLSKGTKITSGGGWYPLGSGISANGNAICQTSNGDVFVGGFFNSAGSAPANTVATWDGQSWNPIGTGYFAGTDACFGLASDAMDNVYAGGDMPGSNHVAKWDGSTWSPLGQGLNAPCGLVAVAPDGKVYVSGEFDQAGGVAANHIAMWDGSSWQALGAGLNSSAWNIVFDSEGNLYAAGRFEMAGSDTVNYIAKWDGTSWSDLGGGLSDQIPAMCIDSMDNIYVGGNFDMAGNTAVKSYAKWDGSSWSALGDTTHFDVHGLGFLADGRLVSVRWARVSFFDGSDWKIFESTLNGPSIYSMHIGIQGELFIGGLFQGVGGTNANNVAVWRPYPTHRDEAQQMVSISLYPNPARGKVYVQGLDGQAANWELLSLEGRRLEGGILRSGEATIRFQSAYAGTYLLMLDTWEGKLAKQLVLKP
jgi:hypothetical protein